MATYRINGVKYNPANWAMLDKAERAACARFAAARERELNTIETTEHKCNGGPFDGATIELQSMCSAPIHVGAWVGHYQGAAWVGTDGGKPVNTHGESNQQKAAPEATGQGFNQLRDLLADLAEDPAERQKTISMRNVSITWPVGAVDDFGDLITGEVPTHCNQSMEFIRVTGREKNKQRVYAFTTQPGHGTGFMNDFGQLTKAPATRTHGANFPRAIEQITHTIGKTRYTINATPEAAANLRARILKAKKWFADKCLTAAKPTAAPVPTPAEAVAALVADAVAAVAIDAAQTTARADELSQVATVADAVACVADELACVADELACVADAVACMPRSEHCGQPPSHTPTGAGFATPGSSQPTASQAGKSGGQRIAGKSGKWVATFHTTPAGLPGMVYTDADGQAQAHEFASGAERMATLQRLARMADAQPATAANVAHLAAFDPSGVDVWQCSTREVQAMAEADFVALVQHLENVNHHTAALCAKCLRAGCDDLAEACTRLENAHVQAGQLTPALALARFAIGRLLRGESVNMAEAGAGSGLDACEVSEAVALVGNAYPPTKAAATPHTPPASAADAQATPPVCAADAPDYTHPLKTLPGDYTDPLKTLGALQITLTRGEGPSNECGKPQSHRQSHPQGQSLNQPRTPGNAVKYHTQNVHISTIKAGDTVEIAGALKTVCRHNIKKGDFLGVTLFGDSYQAGRQPVRLAIIETAKKPKASANEQTYQEPTP